MRIAITTNKKGLVRIFNKDTDEDITDDIKRIDIYVNSRGLVTAGLEFKNVELKLELKSGE
jgi:hypothetical protein